MPLTSVVRRARMISAALCLTGALSILAAGSPSVAAQGRYPASKADAPLGVYPAPRLAIDSLQSLLRSDSLDYGASWRLAQALTTLGALAGDAGRTATRDSLYQRAGVWARRAARIEPNRPEGHYMVAQFLTRTSPQLSLGERTGRADPTLTALRKALELDPAHDGAWNLLGGWHSEIMRLSRVERFVARRLLGGSVMAEASWEEAVVALERAVALRPNWIRHRLDLASVYVQLDRLDEARDELEAISRLSPIDPEDSTHVRRAEQLSERLSGRAHTVLWAGFARWVFALAGRG